MFASGFTQVQLYRAILSLALIVSLLVGVFSLHVRPWAWEKFFRSKVMAQATFDLARLKAGIFYELPGGRVFYAQELDPRKRMAREVFLYERAGDLKRVIRAEEALQVCSRNVVALLLRKGREYEWHQNKGSILISEFEDLRLPIEITPPSEVRRVKALSTQILLRQRDREALAELQWRFSAPLSAFLLSFLGLTLSPLRPRESRFKRFPWALLIFTLFFYAGASLKKAVAQGLLSPWPGVFWSHLGLFGVSLLCLFWCARR
jgi:lipopolysaccharide export system permease protein